MVGINGQYIFTFSIGDQNDFIAENELEAFVMIEEAGNSLPTFQLTFISAIDTILSVLHEDNDLLVSYGKSAENMITSRLAITRVESNRVGQNRREITVVGLYSALGFLGNSNLFITEKVSGLEALQTIVKKHFTLKSNIDKSLDAQNWVQPNITDRAFVNKLWLHSDLDNSFPAVGISSDGTFIVKDVLKELAEFKNKNPNYTWRFTPDPNDVTRDIMYDGDPVFSFDTSLINNWVGYGRQRLVYNTEGGTTSFVRQVAEPAISLTDQMVTRTGINKRFAATGIHNNNVHKNYWPAYQKNVASLAGFSSMKVTISFRNQFYPVKVLDLSMYLEETIEGNSSKSAQYHSGLYFISKVSRSISNRTFTTLVQMTREAPNQIEVV